MRCFRLAAATAAAFTVSIGSVRAADMPRYQTDLPLPREESPLRVDEFVSGWYLRGDLGYRFQRLGGASDVVNGEFASKDLKNAGVLGLGAGYKWRWLRLDLTGDYAWRARFTGSNDGGLTTVGAKLESYTLLANGYVDLGTWWGFTPYLGAGIGSAYLTMSGYETNPATVDANSTSRWNLAWAVHAGVSYNISHNTLLDLSYRHVDLGSITGGPQSVNPLTLKHLSGDEVRLGMRFLLD